MPDEAGSSICLPLTFSKDTLDSLYRQYNHREFVHPDPLEFLYGYEDISDREVVGLVASSLAYGRVAQILISVSTILDLMGPSPSSFLLEHSFDSLRPMLTGFKHRFTTGNDMAMLLSNAGEIIRNYGSLQECFMAGMKMSDSTILPALTAFVEKLIAGARYSGNMFIPLPRKGSACKRLNLFLRWMVRSDEVDPGGWSRIPPSRLIVPLDTHMHRAGLMMGMTCRKQADMRTAMEITDGFRTMVPEDPVCYDFSITRLGIREGIDLRLF